jgi:hypothetical protein
MEFNVNDMARLIETVARNRRVADEMSLVFVICLPSLPRKPMRWQGLGI